MTRSVSPAGRAALMQREGVRLHAYLDSVGVPTIGVGHTGRASAPSVHMGMTITAAEAEEIFARDLAPFEAAVSACVPASLSQNAFDACVSLAFNIGARGFTGSTVVHKLQAGDRTGAADAFLMWSHPPELAGRRRAERAQFLRADGAAEMAIPASVLGGPFQGKSPATRPAAPRAPSAPTLPAGGPVLASPASAGPARPCARALCPLRKA